MSLSDIAEMDERSPGRFGEESLAEMSASPMSNIAHDLCKSSLDPGGNAKKKRPPQRSYTFDTSRRVSGRRSEGMHQMLSCGVQSRSTNEAVQNTKLLFCSNWVQSPYRSQMLDKYNDKENDSAPCSYQSFSPPQKPPTVYSLPCFYPVQSAKKIRWPLEDCWDPNSQDSGYGANDNKEEKRQCDGFQFAEPSGVAPRRMSVDSRSPVQSPMRSSPQQLRVARSSLMRQSSGYESMVDDGFTELIDMETLDDTTHLPSGISSLLSGNLVAPGSSSMEYDVSTTPEFSRTVSSRLRRSLSLCDQNMLSQSLSKVRTCLFRSPGATSSTAALLEAWKDNGPMTPRKIPFSKISYDETQSPQSSRSCKRPSEQSAVDNSPKYTSKKFRTSKSLCLDVAERRSATTMPYPKIPLLQRSMSETEANIKSAVHRSVTDADLTGDFSKPCILPLATGYHQDLKSISSTTLAALLRGEFDDRVRSYKIVDCRYPYEYDGGHIGGAMNLYNKDLIEQNLFDPLTTIPTIRPDTDKRDILVFHCEFSCERGPNLSRFLRSLDRQRNKEHYPALHYPEVYLLHGGYEQFYKDQKEFCSPQDYRPMKHPDHEADLRQFRSKSKSWQGDNKSRVNNSQAIRTNLKRLGF
ncbi:M-phase inducer phosphatase isoform X3 [Harpegnathos saltator]|uniref:M-phase inducer phosphatase isoform X3 n=1 Tax=Harpegnathos saltator TaxID=610380 RepID=UPI0005915277|nr:M-phase inducer phosphatase isoform X3 [Harpegnathos saltator]XP_011149588.1 M-phase inducer phosphatase isoform X3 [Harpegnathos saltator]XP_025161199.1 M-phase inducer phosphatase isoform X3 [Harpegnathos saltator]